MFNILIVIFSSIMCLIALVLFYHHYSVKPKCNVSIVYHISIFIFSYIPLLMGVSILSFELSQHFNVGNNSIQVESPKLLLAQQILYYLTQLLSFIVNPVLMEYIKISEQEEQEHLQSSQSFDLEVESDRSSCCSRFKKALYNQIKYYIILFLVAIGALIVILVIVFIYKIDISIFQSYIDILPSITNIYGLFLFAATIGTGLTMIPSSIYKRANPLNQMRDNLIFLSEPYVKDRPNYRYIIDLCKYDYRQLKKLYIDNDKKLIHRKRWFLALFIFSIILSVIYFLQEISYTIDYSFFEWLLNLIDNKFLNHVIIFVFIASVTALGGSSLSHLNPGSMVNWCNNNCCCCNSNECDCESCLLKVFDILRYRFSPKGTESSTFGSWSTYLQRLVPTIAYHCQQMAGVEGSSLELIIGKLDEFNIYTKIVRYTLPFTIAFGAIFGLCCGSPGFDRRKIRKGMKVFKKTCIGVSDLNIEVIDMLIVDDIEINNDDVEMYRRANRAGDKQLNEPLNQNDYHQASIDDV